MTAASTGAHRDMAALQAGDRVEDEVYRVAQKDLRSTSNGSLYIHAVLADGTGQMLARMWNASQDIYDTIPDGGLMRFRGRVESYKGNRQFIIDGVKLVDPGSVDPSVFLPHTSEDVGAMWDEVKKILRTVENRDLRNLVAKFVNDSEFAAGFRQAPAAVQMHHAYLGGLLEHTRNLLRLAQAICPLYPRVDRDLVLAGILLHDAGKVRELAFGTNIEYTSDGQLVGHIVQCVLWLHEKCRLIEQETGQPFPPTLELSLKHLILAHHGKYEFGSPRLPATPEALMTHYLDNLDAKLTMTFSAIDGDPNRDGEWTEYVRSLETRVFKLGSDGTTRAL